MDNKIRLEVLVASPPTSKCLSLIELMKKLLEEYPDKLRLDIYYAGEKPSVVPTKGYQHDPDRKRRKIPSAYINGRKVASRVIPDISYIKKILEEELRKEGFY